MRQSRLMSVLEGAANVVLGYGFAVLTQTFVFPSFGVNLPLVDNLRIGLVFTLLSFLRGYTLRRLFDRHVRRS